MSRYRLTAKHYLTVPGTEWEQKEIDQATGKQVRRVYKVPRYLDPDDHADCNYPGEIIVCDKQDNAFPRDILFTGPPTVDMVGLDDEAIAKVAKITASGAHPIDSLPATGGTFAESLMAKFESQMVAGASAPETKVSSLETQVSELAKLVGAFVQAQTPKASVNPKL